MKRIYVVTGAGGHLGGTLLRLLRSRGETVRGLLLPGEAAPEVEGVTYVRGDVRDKDSLRPLLEATGGAPALVLHTAGIVDISGRDSAQLYAVNVLGTQNVIDLCLEYKVERLCYVSSVHAIPEQGPFTVLQEVKRFSAAWVAGGYAKTKAEATQRVLDAVDRGLDAVVVQPSGILGPYDRSGNHLVQMVGDYLAGRLPACVRGGYDFVDVRDVAQGCLAAAGYGRKGESYILSNRHYEISEVLNMAKDASGGRSLPVLPLWMARAAAPMMERWAKARKQRPLYTRYSLYTLSSNDRFCHDKATSELGYRPRDLMATVRDTVAWLLRGKLGAAT